MIKTDDLVNEVRLYLEKGCKRIILYGAGKIAKILSNKLNESGLQFDGYCVTNVTRDATMIDGKPVYQIDRLAFNKNETLFVIAAYEHGSGLIRKTLEENGAINIIDCPDDAIDLVDKASNHKKRPTMEVTPHIGCSVNCKFCPQKSFLTEYFSKDKNRQMDLSLEQFKTIIAKLPKDTLIEWSGFVEPFLNPNAVDMMVYADSQGFEQTLYTTLVGATEYKLKQISRINFHTVCLHVADADGYANIPVTNEYLRLLNMVVSMVGTDNKPFVDVVNCQSTPQEKVAEVIGGQFPIYCEMSDRAGLLDDCGRTDIFHFNKKGSLWCERSERLDHNVLLADGTVVLCCNDFGMKHILGNLLECEYQDLMTSETMRQVKRGLVIDESISIICRQCMYAKERNINL